MSRALRSQAPQGRGLVSVPTSPKASFASRSEARVSVDSDGVRSALSAAVQAGARPKRHRRLYDAAEARLGGTERQAGAAFVPPTQAARLARLRRSVGFSARALGAAKPGFRPDWVVMLTLTYAPGVEWKGQQISRLMDKYWQWCRARGYRCRYVWVAELQGRGAVHYHIACWLPVGVRPPKPDCQGIRYVWPRGGLQGPPEQRGRAWWPHGSSNRVVARKAVPYLMKYFSKGSGTLQLPKDCRSYGVGGLEHAERRARRWLGLPGFIKARADIHDEWVRAVGGGWWGPFGLTPIPSEFQRAWLGDAYGLLRVADYGRPFPADGPFNWLHRSPLHG